MAGSFNRVSWKGCAVGCGGVIIIGIILIATTVSTMNRQYKKAADSREILTEKYGSRADFDPGSGPAIPADRLEVFLTVRRSLVEKFNDLGNANRNIRGQDNPEDGGAAPKNNTPRFVSTTYGGVNQLVNLGAFAGERNQALLENGMGFGEYAWIYALVYYGCLGESPILGRSGDQPGFIPQTARKDLADMMRRRADALLAADETVHLAEAVLWRTEADRLADKSYAVPFPDGAPESLVACITEHRDELASLYSRDSDPLELMRLKKFGMGYEDR